MKRSLHVRPNVTNVLPSSLRALAGGIVSIESGHAGTSIQVCFPL